MTINHTPRGVCAREMSVTAEGGVIKNVQVIGGCNGNLKAICALLNGMSVDDAIARLDGLTCGGKPTSCPDQLTVALKKFV